jgi:Heavy-metal resistance
MKRALTILVGGLLVACAAYCLFYFTGTAGHRKVLASKAPELLWLKKEFHLSDAELARIAQLHEAYLPQCRARCQQIEELNRKLTQAIGSASQMTPDIEQLLAERGKVRTDCQAEMLKHFFDVSRTMPAGQGRRYLAWVQERTCLSEPLMNHGGAEDTDHHQ